MLVSRKMPITVILVCTLAEQKNYGLKLKCHSKILATEILMITFTFVITKVVQRAGQHWREPA